MTSAETYEVVWNGAHHGRDDDLIFPVAASAHDAIITASRSSLLYVLPWLVRGDCGPVRQFVPADPWNTPHDAKAMKKWNPRGR